MMCLVECSAQDLLGNSYGGVPSYAAPSYAAPSYSAPSYSNYGAVPSYEAMPSYSRTNNYGGLYSFGPNGMPVITGMTRGSVVAPIPCMCPPAPPKICGSDSVTYYGWCNFRCGVTNNPDLKLAHMGECRLGRSDNQRNIDN